jgi:RimJ/RimL family protein N-acetyltransferase
LPVNAFSQPVGETLPDWQPARFPKVTAMDGGYCTLELVDNARHAADLYEAFAEDADGRMWTYMVDGPFASVAEMEQWLDRAAQLTNQVFYAIIDKRTGRAVGLASYLRIQPAHGVVEVGSIAYAPCLQRTVAATEAMFLMMRHAFEAFGYRRYEWKCDSLNEPSRKAAERFGFSYDGLFRQAIVYRGRNRDTAWYSILDSDWPTLKPAYEAWLAPDNFDAEGRQRRKLADLIAEHRSAD